MIEHQHNLVLATPPARGFRITLPGFFAIVFVISWIGAAPSVLATWVGPTTSPQWVSLVQALAPLKLLMFFGTLIATLIVVRVNYGRGGIKTFLGALLKFRVAAKWYGLALLGPGLIVLLVLIGSRWLDPNLPPIPATSSILIGTAQVFLVYLFLNTEEIAWRGYALPQLQNQFSPLRANLLLTMVWGIFHSPYFFMQGGHPAGYSVLVFVCLVLALGLVAGYVFNATGGSLIISHLLHQSLNGWTEGARIFPVMNNGSQLPFNIAVVLFCLFGVAAAVALHRMRPPSERGA